MNQNPYPLNLDHLVATRAQAIVNSAREKSISPNDLDNTVTKALGVLQENGIYAFMLYLLSRNAAEQPRAGIICQEVLALLTSLPYGWGPPLSQSPSDILSYVNEQVASKLERLIMAKDLVEQMLIYARYGAKAWARAS